MERTAAVSRNQTVVDEVDWEALYRQHLPRVYNYFRYRLGDDQVAEDMTAATFEKAWRARQDYRQDLGAFTTWLYAIARNVARDHYRRRRPAVPLESLPDRVVERESVEETVQRRQEVARLARLLEGLGEQERELIALKYGAGFTNREIAGLTDLSETNVGTILYRVVGKLRRQWEEAS